MNKLEQTKSRRPSLKIYLLAAIALMLLGLPQIMLAQSQWTTNGSNINNTNSGNVGVGTTTPVDKLEVSATSINNIGIRVTNSNASGDYPYGVMLQGGSSGWGVTDWPNAFLIEGTANGGLVLDSYLAPLKFQTGRVTRMTIDTNGKVGIGTTTPGAKFHVVASSGAGGGTFQLDTSTLFSNWTAVYPAFELVNTNQSNNNVSLFQFSDAPSGASHAGIGAVNTSHANKYGDLFFYTKQSDGYQARMGIYSGNVGIGTTTPLTKLHVVGDITVTGNIAAKYQDVAEWVPSRQKLAPGTVVILDVAQSNQVTASTQAYDTKVAGVVSAQPGVILGEAADNKEMVATTGRVKVKVDATSSPIKVGDLLVTSDKPGMAMKSDPLMIQGRPFHSPGTLIGKALEPLEKGVGEILVLLSLQ